jgi:hypothetical protein
MAQKIYKDGTDQYIMTRLGSINNTTGAQGILLGASEGYSLSSLIDNIIVVFSEYKTEDESLVPEITWNSTAGMWKINIPSENITRYGTAWLNISGYDESGISIIPTAIEIETVSHMAYQKVIPYGLYTLDASANTITLSGEFASITEEQVISIRNITKNQLIYDSTNTNRGQITISAGVISFTYNGQMANTDKIQIIVNTA